MTTETVQLEDLTRAELFPLLEANKAQRKEQSDAHEQVIEHLRRRVELLKQEMASKQRELNDVLAELHSKSLRPVLDPALIAEGTAITMRITDTTDPAVTALAADFNRELECINAVRIVRDTQRTGERNPLDGSYYIRTESNEAAVRRQRQLLTTAIQKCRELYASPLEDEVLAARLNAIRKSVPPFVNSFEKVNQ